jgi:hypothetical protein
MAQAPRPVVSGTDKPKEDPVTMLHRRVEELEGEINLEIKKRISREPLAVTGEGDATLREAQLHLIRARQRLADPAIVDVSHDAEMNPGGRAPSTRPPAEEAYEQSEAILAQARAEAERIRVSAAQEASELLARMGEHLAEMAAAYRQAMDDARATVHRLAEALHETAPSYPERGCSEGTG